MKLKYTNTQLRDDQLQLIKQRVQNASPGLWLVTQQDDTYNVKRPNGDVIATVYNESDAKLIARSKHIIVKLIREIEELRGVELLQDVDVAEYEQISWNELLEGE